MSRTAKSASSIALALLLAVGCCSARAQYVGRVNTQAQAPTLRATAVLEYTGDLAKPNASRLIPIAVWDGSQYQPGGLYLAQPVPLTVQSGTQYILEQAGTPKGFFDVKAAADMAGSWIAVGSYQKPTPPRSAGHHSHRLPIYMEDSNPHFAHVPVGETKAGAAKTTAQSAPPIIDPDRPTLHHRSSSDDNSQENNAPSNPVPPIDPDRPVMREPSPSAPAANSVAANEAASAPETATAAVDPNRPHLSYGKPEHEESLDAPAEINKLSGAPIGLKQIVAVSDAVTRPQHSYVYSWPDPQAEAKMRSQVEAIAQQLLAASVPKPPAPPQGKTRPHPRRHAALKKPAPAVLPTLTGEQLTAYQLAYGEGATLVFSAVSGEGDQARYITLIAQPDFNGTPVVLFQQITSERELSVIPHMRLIDAVDTDADNRAELIFELESQTGRQYAIYRVANGSAEQVFATGSQPQAP